MKRKDILKEPAYWITLIQTELYNCAMNFMKRTGKNRTQLAEHLNVSKGYVTQLLSGDYNYSLTKLVETCMAFGYVPKVSFTSLEEEIYREEHVCKFVIKLDNGITGSDYEKADTAENTDELAA